MKVLQVVATYLPAVRHGGPPRAVHGLARALGARGHTVEVFTTDLHGDSNLDVPTDRAVDLDGVAVSYFHATRPRRLARAPAMSSALARRVADFDLVHLHGLFLWPLDAAARAAERSGVPWVISPRGMLVRELIDARGRWRKRLWLATAGRRTLGRARRLIVSSELEARQALAAGAPAPPAEIVPNGVEPFASSDEGLIPEAARTVLATHATFLYLGRLSWKKGLDRLVAALARVPTARLILAGNDDEGIGAGLDALARRLGVGDRVLRLGFVDGAAKSALLGAARALVLPSISENFGNVVLEAWANGTPAIVAPGVGLATECAEAGAGLVEDGTEEGLASALRRLASDAGAARSMGERGRRRIDERFTWARVAGIAERVYESVVSEPGG